MDRARLKELSRNAIRSNQPSIILIFLISLLITGAASYVSRLLVINSFFGVLVSVCIGLFSTLIETGFSYCCLKAYNVENPDYKDLFYCLTYLGKFLGAAVVVGIYTFLWSLLFIVPGIIKAYSYSQTFFIIMENPDIGISDAITQSIEMMDGHKMDLFVLDLSFILWYLLCLVTIGIASLYVSPYVGIAKAGFYKDLSTAPYKFNN